MSCAGYPETVIYCPGLATRGYVSAKHGVVRDLHHHSPNQFVAAVAEAFSVEPETGPVKPQRPREFGMYLKGSWYRLRVADANQMMPPKSIWFEPKLADGLVSHLLD